MSGSTSWSNSGPARTSARSEKPRIIEQFRSGRASTREKAAGALDDFEMWFSARRWARHGTAAQFRDRLMQSIANLRESIASPQ